MFFIDISVPRNIDPAIATIEDSFLFDVDDLESIAQTNLREREREAQSAEAIIESEVDHFIAQMRSLDIGPTVVEVKEMISLMALNEFRRNRKRLGPLSQEQEAAIQNVLIPALANKLSHPIIVHLRESARNGEVTEVLNELRKMMRIE